MSDPPTLIRAARREAGLTQVELGRRMGTTQTSVARMERRGANPTVATLRKALRAADQELTLEVRPVIAQVDEGQIRAHLRMTPAERVRYHDSGYRNMAEFVRQARGRG